MARTRPGGNALAKPPRAARGGVRGAAYRDERRRELPRLRLELLPRREDVDLPPFRRAAALRLPPLRPSIE